MAVYLYLFNFEVTAFRLLPALFQSTAFAVRYV